MPIEPDAAAMAPSAVSGNASSSASSANCTPPLPFALPSECLTDKSSRTASVQTAKPDPSQATNSAPFPPPKTDKPRPHVCGTCQRSFARLEHLKRHERSHTKEKPFECPQCTRCFARRDLLLRHQQKLHQQGATSSRPRTGRRESTTGLPPNSAARVRKNSVASSVGGPSAINPSMRPRANTISHVDPAALNSLLASHSASLGRAGHPGHSHHASLSGMGGAPSAYDFRGMSSVVGGPGQHHGLPKLDTHLGFGMGGGLRTAPIPGFAQDEFELDKFFGTSGSTINPNQLHHFNAGMSAQSTFNAFGNPFATTAIDEDDFAWSAGLDGSIMFPGPNDPVGDGSSPSAISTTSQSGFSEVMVDGSGQPTTTPMWHQPLVTHTSVNPTGYALDTMAPVFPELMMNNNTVSEKELGEQGAPADFYMSTPPAFSTMSPTAGIPGMPNQYFQPPITFNSDSGSISSASMNGSARHSSVTSVSSDTLTDATRQALVFNLSQALGYGHPQRKFSQPQISSPLSANPNKATPQVASLPTTVDLQRYVNAYIQYFHPHLPFLHIPTLSFDTPAYTHQLRAASNYNHDGMVGGGGCLILAIAAIGALYEFEHGVAKDLFESAKKMILYYLDERRRAGLSAAVNGPGSNNDPVNKPPLWLVQAMALNLIFGHNCGDKQAADVASTHCAALVSLAKAAGLDRPAGDASTTTPSPPNDGANGDIEMGDGSMPTEFSRRSPPSESIDEHAQWIRWKTAEERKRTYFAVFSMSSLLVSAYAHAPRILNSEIRLDLPCEEDLWSVDNPQAWAAMGGPMIAQSKGLSFNAAMTYLLEASTRQQPGRANGAYQQSFGGDLMMGDMSDSEIRPSTFGCYVLINALHVYIWETRQRHTGRLWKSHETEAMHAQVEPALKAWQSAWRANPNHSIERPSPFGPLSADCIPLLDLAYVRLFVNLGRAKELLWQRDFDGMAAELAKGVDVVAHADETPERSEPMDMKFTDTNHFGAGISPGGVDGLSPGRASNGLQSSQSSKRERHLRKAAFYAADSLSMADKLGATYAEFTARELPNSSAMCTFDCAQILAEWLASVQDRVGRFLGVLGKDEIDYTAVPAILLLEEEDVKLIQKIADILHTADMKLAYDITSNSIPMLGGLSNLGHCGYGTKLLMVTAYMLEKSAVWPGKFLVL